MATDYERIGGGPAVSAVVDALYARLTVDPQVGHYFEDIVLPEQKRHMIAHAHQGARLARTPTTGAPSTRPTSRSASPTPTTTGSARP